MSTTEWIQSWNDFLDQHPVLQINDRIEIKPPVTSPDAVAQDENFWKQIQSLFPAPPAHINLNNGGVCSNPSIVEKAFLSYYSLLNTSPSFYTWKVMEGARETVKQGLATMIHASSDEIAIFRNATEALNNAIFGIQLNEGDEVLACNQDYIKCISSWKQRELREKIKLNWVDLNGQETNEEVIDKYLSAITPKTKVLHLTHVINWNGQILPVEIIAREAKKKGLIVLLDAAHSFAILDTDVQKIECDYLGAALHKWLSGPIAGGVLYIKKNQIASTYPLASAVDPLSASIKKFEEMSIQLMPNLLGLGHAIHFHFLLGRDKKQARLRWLRKRWTDVLQKNDAIHFHLLLNDEQCAAIASFTIDGKDPIEFEKEIFEKGNIHVVGFNWPNLSGIRVTPNINTQIEDIDHFAKTILALCPSN